MLRPIASLFSLLTSALIFMSCVEQETTVDKATKKGILIMGNGSEPKALDPQIVSGVVEFNILRGLFEGLCVEHPSDDSISLPGGALSWSANADFTVWNFQLNPMAKWSDGVPVTTEDFLFAYERMLHPDFPSRYASMLYFIHNAEEFNKSEVTDFSEVGVEALNDFELKITLKAPTPFLPAITQFCSWFPVPKHKILEFGRMEEPYTEWTHEGNIVSNGPFQLKKWRQNHYIELEKNPYYWDKNQVNLNGIQFLPTKNINTEARMFMNGQLHVTYDLPPDYIPIAKQKYPEETKQELYIGTRLLRTNVTRSFTENTNVRKALSLSIDRQSLIDNILQGGQKVAGSVTPPFGAYQPQSKTTFNPEAARRALAEAGYSDPESLPEISFVTVDRDVQRRMAEAMQAMWREHLGLKVRIIQREWKTYLKMRNELDFDIIDGGWIGDYLDPTTYLDLWKGVSGNNSTGWSDPGYETILAEAERISDPQLRYEKLLEAESYLMDHLPAIPIYHYTTNYMLSTDVKNWHPLLLHAHPYKFLELKQN